MNYSFTRIASLVLAFGLFISCNTFQSTSNPNNAEELTPSQLRDRIASIDQKLATDSTANLLYQKGHYLTKLAQKINNPQERTPLYKNAQQVLEETSRSKTASTSLNEKARELLNVSWSHEHNKGVKLMQNDSTIDSSRFKQAAAHFTNATVIIPDSAISYKMGARAYYQHQDVEHAISMLQTARRNISDMPVVLLEQLAFLYLENDEPEHAIAVYEETESFSQKNLNLLHGLSNAYISAGKHQQSIKILTSLVEEKPENIIYKQSLATELYHLASEKVDSIQKDLAPNTTAVAMFATVDSLLQRAETQLTELIEQNPKNLELKKRLAQFYHNSASNYQQLLPLLASETQTTAREKIHNYLTSSLPLFEELVKKQPQHKPFWQNLYVETVIRVVQHLLVLRQIIMYIHTHHYF